MGTYIFSRKIREMREEFRIAPEKNSAGTQIVISSFFLIKKIAEVLFHQKDKKS